MVLLDDGVKHLGKVLVGVSVPGVDAAVLVIKVHGTSDGLGQGEARRGGLVGGKLVPHLLGDVLGHQGVLGLDLREGRHDATDSGVEAAGGLKVPRRMKRLI